MSVHCVDQAHLPGWVGGLCGIPRGMYGVLCYKESTPYDLVLRTLYQLGCPLHSCVLYYTCGTPPGSQPYPCRSFLVFDLVLAVALPL